ncbi:MAG: hypothetical protein UHU21_09920, partial [Lachnospiraceae bacterium]|nr:hypothetical protein [Lachnospiraceae bacterium]
IQNIIAQFSGRTSPDFTSDYYAIIILQSITDYYTTKLLSLSVFGIILKKQQQMQSDPIYMDCRMLQQPTLSVCCFTG